MNLIIKNNIKLQIILASLIVIVCTQSCKKAKYKTPTCNSNCININAIFYDSTLHEPFANQKLSVFATHNTGIGNGFSKLWEMTTNAEGEANFDVSSDDVNSGSGNSGHISFFISNNKYSDAGTTGNRVDLFIRESDIGKTVSEKFILYKD